MNKAFLALAIALTGCGPLVTDSRQGDARGWLAAGARIEATSGVKLSKLLAPCSGPGCAHEQETMPGSVVGLGSWSKFQARVKPGLTDEMSGHVKVHELLHTLLVRHVTSVSVMNPYVDRGRDCISNAELWQLCRVFPGRCRWERPECTVPDDWQLYVPDENGDEQPVKPSLVEERMRRGEDLWQALMKARDLL